MLGRGSELTDLRKMQVVYICNFASNIEREIVLQLGASFLWQANSGSILLSAQLAVWVGLGHGSTRSLGSRLGSVG